ncbi:Pkinase-domain-containing protein [Hesseltinella vesiculosa]|uniref:non-specific serine/threonine protein kinase n=1 Tax=Hesseltinella vesiculosa TaxID=101127 RepID=A0A1X2GEL8_9FUNG|nr:Pkinase-domain-containing protein [Hesseltinella vesiculosa]
MHPLVINEPAHPPYYNLNYQKPAHYYDSVRSYQSPTNTGYPYYHFPTSPQSPASRRASVATPAAIVSRQRSQKSLRDRRRSSGALSSNSIQYQQKPRKCIGDYYVGKTLGKGASGRVKLGIHKHTGEQVAIKIISKAHLAANPAIEKAVRREIAIMKLIRHPNIMSLVDVIDDPSSSELYLILEYVQGGELFEYLVSRGRLSDSEARRHFQQIILGLDFCHHHLICHRDLKPENLLLDSQNNIKIADFGMASLQPAGSMLETSCGSPHYASPEIVAGMPYNGSASDIWSCGVILYALLTGRLPFDDENIRQLLKKVKAGKFIMPSDISKTAQDLIRRILVVDPSKRLTMKQIMMHPWFCESEPINLHSMPVPPTASEIGRPVWDPSDVDDRILETIKFLWGESRDEPIVQALISKEHNMQKVVYVLLQQHAERYWQNDHDDDNDEAEDSEESGYKYRTIGRNTVRTRRCQSIEVTSPQTATPVSTVSPTSPKMEAQPYATIKSTLAGTLRRKNPFAKAVLQDHDSSSEPDVYSGSPTSPRPPVLPEKSTLRRLSVIRNKIDPTARTNHQSTPPLPASNDEEADLIQRRTSKVFNTKRLSVRVPNVLHKDDGTRRFSLTVNGSRQKRKELDMTLFQPFGNHNGSSLISPPGLSNVSSLSCISNSSGHSHPPHPSSSSSYRKSNHHGSAQHTGSTSDVHTSTSSGFNNPMTPSLLSNSSTITTASSTSPVIEDQVRASWLNQLFFFKQPKVEMKVDHQGKTRQVKCRVEILALHDNRMSKLVRFTQQQGDGVVLSSILRQLHYQLGKEYPSLMASTITADF